MAEEQNTGLSGIFQDPNFITGMAVLGANADPNRHWSEGYKDASGILSNMQRSALARAELELRKQKMQQEQAQIEAARERAAQMREALSAAETPEDYARAMMQYGEGGQVSSGMQALAGLQKTPSMSLEEQAFADYQAQNPNATYIDFARDVAIAKGAGKVQPAGPKPPSGYRWVDEANPSAGLEPIPGGPATKVAGSDIGRMAVAKEAVAGLDRVDSMITDESGDIDRTALRAANLGTPGRLTPKGAEIRQAYYQAVELLLRLKTGAAATREEVEQNLELYMPKANDSDALIRQKQQALKNILNETVRLSEQGKGGADASTEPTEEDDVLSAADKIVEGL